MPNDDLMPIGVFARRSGLTSSALRFYADSGLLPPAEVAPVSGYRFYGPDQVDRAVLLRRLREIAMPLAGVAAVLDAGADTAARLVDEHVARIADDAAAARRTAAVIKSALGDVPGLLIAVLKGPVLADAVEQVLTATAQEAGPPVLAGLRVEVDHEAITLTATDRYRLSTRTLVPAEPPGRTWAGTIDGAELRSAVAGIRRGPLVRVEAAPHGIRLRVAGREDHHCRSLPGEFPDHRLLLASLGEATTRVTVAKDALLRALEEHPGERVGLHVTGRAVHVLDATGPGDAAAAVPADGERPAGSLPAVATGRPLRIWFELTTLYPAVSTAIGADVMLDLRGHDEPVTVRSADRGDLTTLVMPVSAAHPA
ncbi:MerR family transcriptional regulator [Streptomyces sp. NPDC035033]|uniref:DNA polymerase III subunit beta family protein n=1 Tax=Streptomyces sp. NPDC035033 TaxID=3155368 RepID=UPI0034116853